MNILYQFVEYIIDSISYCSSSTQCRPDLCIHLHILNIPTGSKCLKICPNVFSGYTDFVLSHSTPMTNEERIYASSLLYCCLCLGLTNIPTSLPAGFKLLRIFFFFFWLAFFYCPVDWERIQ